jgi:hypothetical protein
MLNELWSFINNNKYEIAYRGWNGLTASAVAYQLYSDPIANASEYLPDILLHSIEAFIPDTLPAPIMVGLNLLRAGQAGNAFITGQVKFPIVVPSNIPVGMLGSLTNIAMLSAPTSIPTIANGVDVLNHALNISRHLSEMFPGNDLAELSKNPKTFTPTRLAMEQPDVSATKDINHHGHDLRSRNRAVSF